LHNLRDQYPEIVRELQDQLRNLERQAEAWTISQERVAEQDDPQLRRRLRALGYLE
jgi:hypothetical protein